MIALAILLAAAMQHDYLIARECGFLRIDCLVAAIAGGAGAAFCLGGAMHYLDLALAGGVAWYLRAVFVVQKRILMVAQMAAAGLVVGALGLMIFHEPIPDSERTIPDRGWVPGGADAGAP